MVPNRTSPRDVFAKETQLDKKVSTPWGQADHVRSQQLAWTQPAPAAEGDDGSLSAGSDQAGLSAGPALLRPTGGAEFGRDLPARATQDHELNAILGAGTSFHGTLSFSGRVRIDGEFSGQALGGQLLVVGDGARVQGELRAERVIILGGSVRADISAADGIELYVPAQVSGDLRAPEIHLDRGVKFQGTCDLTELPHLDGDESRNR